MGVRILEGSYDGGDERAVLIDSVTERPLALPMFKNMEEAEAFLAWCAHGPGDPRQYAAPELDELHSRWLEWIRAIPLDAGDGPRPQ